MSGVRIEQNLKKALSVEERELRELDAMVRKFRPMVNIEAEVGEGVVYTFKSVDELFALPNSRQEPILLMRWTAFAKSPGPPVMDFSLEMATKEKDKKNIHLYVSGGDEQAVRHMAERVRTWLAGCRAPYGWIAESRIFGAGALAIWLGLMIFGFWLLDLIPKGNALIGVLVIATLLSLLIGGAAVSDKLMDTLKTELFPLLAIKLGHGQKRHAIASLWRTGVLLAIVVGVAGSIIAAPLLK